MGRPVRRIGEVLGQPLAPPAQGDRALDRREPRHQREEPHQLHADQHGNGDAQQRSAIHVTQIEHGPQRERDHEHLGRCQNDAGQQEVSLESDRVAVAVQIFDVAQD